MASSEQQTRVPLPLKCDTLVPDKERLAAASTPPNNRKTAKMLCCHGNGLKLRMMSRFSVAMVTVCLQVRMPEVSVHPGGTLCLALNLQLEETLHLTEKAPSLWQVRSTGTCTQYLQTECEYIGFRLQLAT